MTLFYEAVIFNSEVEITIKYLSFSLVNNFKPVGKVQVFISEKKCSYNL